MKVSFYIVTIREYYFYFRCQISRLSTEMNCRMIPCVML